MLGQAARFDPTWGAVARAAVPNLGSPNHPP